jgi:hypothetical protein
MTCPFVGFAPVMLQTLDIGPLFGKERKDAVLSLGRQVKMSFPARKNAGKLHVPFPALSDFALSSKTPGAWSDKPAVSALP